MSLKRGVSVDNNILKFLELKKYQISKSTNNGFNCLTIDNNNQMIFVINDNNLFVIQLNHLLSFEWNKSVVNDICDHFQHFSIGFAFTSHFISLSAKGFGNKLAVCGTDASNSSPFIVFFDLNDIYKNQNQAKHYSRINLMNSTGLVSDIVWHPEMSDNLFGCCLTDGSLYIISIGDFDSRTTSIWTHIPAHNNAMCLCWSPKGKQLVVGHRYGFFTQYKLIEGKPLQEVKKTKLINDLNEHNVIAIKWIVSSLFAMAITQDMASNEKDTHLILVSTPTKALPQFVDFGSVCLDNFMANDWYRISLLHFNNIIFCSTSMSPEVAIIGCDADKDLSLLDNWSQWVLEENSRIYLPIDGEGNETYLRGISLSKGTQNLYKINVNETYGGLDCPVLLILNSSGILVPYLVIDRTAQLKGPMIPNIVKPPVVASPLSQTKPNTSTPILSANIVPQTKVMSRPDIPSFGSPLTSTILSPISASKPTVPIQQQMVKNSQSLIPQTMSSNDMTSSKSKTSTVDETIVATNDLYFNEIKEQIKQFNKIFSETKKKFSKINVRIGEKEEQIKLKTETRILEEVLPEIQNNLKMCSKDTTTLQSSLIESFSLLEEGKSINDRNVDAKYRHLLKQRALDPITARRMQEIHSLNEYIEIQLRELDSKFEQEWHEWLEGREGAKAKPQKRIQSNPNCDLIYKALANNQKVINVLKLQLDSLEALSSKGIPKTRLIKESVNESQNKKIIESLSKTLSKSSIKDIEDIQNDRVFALKTISKQKKINLRNFLESRSKVPVRRSVDNSSHFISATEKLKEKHKTLQLSAAKVDSFSINKTPEVKTTLTSIDNKVTITSTVVNVNKNTIKETPKTNVEKPSNDKNFSMISLLKNDSKKDFSSDSNKSMDSKSTEIFQSFASKPLSFNLTSTPFVSPSRPQTTFKTQTITPSLQTSTPILSSLISSKAKPETDSSKTLTESTSSLGNVNKSVSFGNTTIINPIECSPKSDHKLDTISELSETDSTSITLKSNSKSVDLMQSLAPELTIKPTFGVNLSLDSSDFNLSGDSNSVQNELIPKYDDISPPTTPEVETRDVVKTSVVVESDDSKVFPILKTTLSTKIEDKTIETIPSNSNISSAKIETPVQSMSNTLSSNSLESMKFSTSSSIAPPLITPDITNSQTVPNSSNETNSQTIPKSETITSPFGLSFSQTPFASNSFSFGNTPNQTTTALPFSQGLAFGGSPGFGAANQTPVSVTSSPQTTSASLSFGQQNSTLNNLSFCGLGGHPSAESANKNAFGGTFSSPPLQASPQTFTPTTQSSPFGVKPSSGGFGGNFSTGSAGVGQSGFAAFQSSPQQSPQQLQPIFGGSPVFGGAQQPAFGGSPTFAGNSQQSAFGSAPTFGGPPPMGSISSTFASQSTGAFGTTNANSSNTGLSFGALASGAQQPQQTPTPFGGGFSGFGSSDSFSFTQRRK